MAEGRGVVPSIGLGVAAASVAVAIALAALALADRELITILRSRLRGGPA
jgi:hypothetical protein